MLSIETRNDPPMSSTDGKKLTRRRRLDAGRPQAYHTSVTGKPASIRKESEEKPPAEAGGFR
jgi:hypothetical protein